MLSESGFEVGELLLVAGNGWTTGDLLDRVSRAEISGTFDFVSLQIGVNNQYRGYPESEYRAEFRRLLEIAGSFANGNWERVLVLSIPDWGAAPFAEGLDRGEIGKEIDAFNAINREETLAAGAQYLDVTPISRQVLDNPELAAEDGLHLSGEMYRMWARMVLDLIKSALLERLE
jgi:lysophospholipase L1-like esterase